MIRIIREEEPSKPSTRLSTDESLPSLAALRQTDPRKLMAMLRGELDWVVMKCLEKQRDRRYETANALARDIQRYLADEAVEARPPSASYRLAKLARRHKVALITTGIVAAALVIGTALSLWQAVRARHAESTALNAERAAVVDRDEATRRRNEAESAAGESPPHALRRRHGPGASGLGGGTRRRRPQAPGPGEGRQPGPLRLRVELLDASVPPGSTIAQDLPGCSCGPAFSADGTRLASLFIGDVRGITVQGVGPATARRSPR